ncbi:acetylornithine deacetylase [Aurantimonas aggregata]|uniref:Acetylornithine deacetylase n=1 Tax=Aurantimonas aggregata TaxID=2047720 RepID=A0A6L9MJ69_9HYPH|nr:acetylornithine deacetylase [Aurantimonas aggregata]NDV87662.1 acetylornithine deacetylase [Aurantimonas aggregata]
MHLQSSPEFLRHLVGFDTTSSGSNLALIDFVEAYLAGFGVASERVYDASGQKANLWATIGPADVPGIVLSGHTDVVPVAGQEWRSDPFTLTKRDGRLHGRGACDMKGFIACVLAAVPNMLATDLARPIHLAFSYDEEVGCVGVVGLLEALKGRATLPQYCVVGEPTSMAVVVAHKAKRSARVTVTGRACHSSLAPQGVNAIEYAALFIARLREIGARLAREGKRDEAYDVPFTTAHTGKIHGGTALNIVPDACQFEFEFRVMPGEDPDALVAEIAAYARDVLETEMRAIAPEAGIAIEVFAAVPGIETAPESGLVKLAQRFAGSNGHAKVAYGTEAGRFKEILGIETVICGPGRIAEAHRPDEYVEIAQLERCDAFLAGLINWAADAAQGGRQEPRRLRA